MIIRRQSILGILLGILWSSIGTGQAWAQGYEWLINVTGTYSHPNCSQQVINFAKYTFNGELIDLNLYNEAIDDNTLSFTIKGNDWDDLDSHVVSLAIGASCSDVTIDLDFTNAMTACTVSGTASATGAGGGTLSLTYQAFPALRYTLTDNCGSRTATASSCTASGTYSWKIYNADEGTKYVTTTTRKLTISPEFLLDELEYTDPYANITLWVEDPDETDRSLSESESFSVAAPAPTAALVDSTDISCYEAADGKITISISNFDVDNFLVAYDNITYPQYSDDMSAVPGSAIAIEGLHPGDWSISVTNHDGDEKGYCSVTLPTVTIEEPTEVTAEFTRTRHNGYDISCHNGSNGQVTVTASGGTGTYTSYSWKDETDSEIASTTTITGQSAGTYDVYIVDSNDCEASASIELTEPDTMSVSFITSNYRGAGISCPSSTDGSLTATPSGGVATTASPYTYAWTEDGTNFSTSNQVTGLSANVNYTVTVTDANGCTETASTTLTAPDAITLSITQGGTPLVCPGDATVSLTATGVQNSSGTVTYDWGQNQTSSTITDKGAGTYTVIVTDNLGCQGSEQVILDDPAGHTITLSTTNYNGSMIACPGGDNGGISAVVNAPTGETLDVRYYAWTKGTTTVNEGQNVTAISDLDAGWYVLTVSYKDHCTVKDSLNLTEPAALNVNVTSLLTTQYHGQDISCYNATDGSIRAQVSGGTVGSAGYTYLWNDDNTSTTQTVTGLGADDYEVLVTDVNGCTETNSITLANPEPVNASLLLSDYHGYGVACNNDANGNITATGEGGTGTYTYSWSTGANTAAITNLSAGTYTLTIADNNNCSNTVQDIITEPTALSFSVQDFQNIACFNGQDGSITLVASGGADDYQYSIDNGTTWQTEDVFNALTAGNYTLTLKDINNCTTTTSTTLTQPPIIEINFTDIANALCAEAIGRATADVSGGVPGYTYRWENSREDVVGTEPLLNNVLADIYTLFVEDTHGCPMERDVVITSTDGANVTYTATDTRCFNTTDGSATLTITGGASPYTTTWPLPETTEWSYPTQMEVLANTGDVLMGTFSDPGTYTLGFTVYLGECVDNLSKSITILRKLATDNSGGRLGYEAFVKNFALYPNPNDGVFEVGVELAETSSIVLSVWNVTNGILLAKKQQQNKDEYNVKFDLRPLSPGTYVLRLYHAQGIKYLRFVVYKMRRMRTRCRA